ncbi:hypothetical protein ACFVH4_18835 [Nocardia ignorata]|uniref:hypothetical protein n=1 Tax=Nocardia ignorata TaxID=145285 RepID=UPI00363D9914
MRLRIFGRHARHDFAEGRETVAELLARIDALPFEPQYAHLAGPDDYPTAVLPKYTLAQLEQRADGSPAPVPYVEVDGGRPLSDLDYVTVMGGLR